MTVTIFTPTYNRAYRLAALYDSLKNQTSRDFEWLIIDDGSSDGTEELVKPWIDEQVIPVRYIRQANGGKHRAINRGVKEACGELFFIVDSDDTLTTDAVEQILKVVDEIKENEKLCGVCFRRLDLKTHEMVGTLFPEDGMYASSLEWVYKYKVGGDKAEIVLTNVLRKYPFPEYDGENFVPEALVWNRIADSYQMICKNKGIYLCEYLPDGLSVGFKRNLKRNPQGFGLFYRETMKRGISLKVTLKNMIRALQCGWYAFRKR